MSTANRLFLLFLAALLVAGVVWYGHWFSNNFERRSHQVRTDVSPEARRNRFLAAELFLQRTGREAAGERNRDLFALQPGPYDTLFIGSQTRLFIERNHERLLQWVEQGGHLIFVPFEADEEIPLLERLGVELVFLEQEEDIELHCEDSVEPCEQTEEGQDKGDSDEEPQVTVTFETDRPGEYQARFLADRYLNDLEEQAEVVVGDAVMPNLLRFSLGEGSVTLLSDNLLFRNDEIEKKDHAYLLAKLVGGEGKVWFFYSAEMPSLLENLWRRAPYLMLLGGVLLLLAGWQMLLRHGPRLRLLYDGRRNLLEHLDASAAFGWRTDRARGLFQANRDGIELAWRRRHPQLNTLGQAERCAWIGEKSGIAAGAIERTLYSEQGSEQDLIRASAVLQQLALQLRPAAGDGEQGRGPSNRL